MTESLDIDLDDMQEILGDFLIEADELIESLDTNFVKLESTPDDLDLLNEIFRAAHTVKGTSSFLGLEQVTELTHKMEDILNKLRKSELAVTPEIMDILLEALDILKVLIGDVRSGTKREHDLTSIIDRLVAACNGEGAGAAAPTNAEKPAEPAESTLEAASEATPDPVQEQKKAGATPKHPTAEATIRVDAERLDTLMNMVGELVLGRNSLTQTINRLNVTKKDQDDFEHLTQASNSINFITTELQMAVMKMRMQPVGKVFNKFPRLVRDIARDRGKQINLEIFGESTELDKAVIEEIGDPLVHVIRNSCDHGLESPEERTVLGKSEVGTVKLEALQEGSHIIIRVSDDGRGFDIDAIRAKAVERELITQAEIDRLSDKEAYKFVLEPGFSTAKVVTDISGRGVGMDVVRTNIEKLNGTIEFESAKNVGTTISIKLPLTLAIIQGLLVESDNEVFILPLASVLGTVKREGHHIHSVNGCPVFKLRDEIVPIINLGYVLNLNSSDSSKVDKPYIVIVGLGARKLGIQIDRFLGQEEVVIKSLGGYLGSREGMSGATILGDGRIRMILDIAGIFKIAGKRN